VYLQIAYKFNDKFLGFIITWIIKREVKKSEVKIKINKIRIVKKERN
jgi:hypothetical protein